MSRGKGHEKRGKEPTPWDKQSPQSAGKHIEPTRPTTLYDDGVIPPNKKGKGTFAAHRSHSHEPLWSPPPRQASTPRAREPAPWDKGSPPVYNKTSAAPAPWDRQDSAHRTGVSTKARQTLLCQKAWSVDVSKTPPPKTSATPDRQPASPARQPSARPSTSTSILF
eukprot:TRINITY_DN21565_c0_g1_i1.p1 TRINITY_DN21565_c0_g1~~TRINITY_DN21565_c0_g1_i1.p1  ORF type:complete len:166 (+),score=14.36 TRINITY_DN21565_c0_g1_i1:173-670(+)